MAGLSASAPSNRVVLAGNFTADEPPADWESWKAEVDAKLKKIADSEAAAKKKAAGKPSVKVGGRIFADWYGYSQDAASVGQITDQDNGFRFDTVRMFVAGSAFHVMDYKVQFDFAGTQKDDAGKTLQAGTFKDVFIAFKELPVLGHVKIGHYKEPFSLDQLTSSRFITFMERSLADTFSPKRNVGIMAYDHTESENMTWAIGAFISEVGDEPPIFKNDSGGTAVTTRYTYLPWYDEATNGRGLLHLGAAYSFRDIADGTAKFETKPEADLGDILLGTGDITSVSDVQLLGLEAAFVYGPFRIQSEYFKGFVNRTGFADPEFDGAYGQVSYFLTGEQRKYKRSAGSFSDRVVPFENFFRVRDCDGCVQTGKGAWELAYRVSYLDLNSAVITAGNATNHTFGVNWYLNPYARLMFNYVNSDLREGGATGNMDIFETRAQIDF
ncbi:MAG: OprO/OprP family phosphate-selective porin [Planctomycetota bacterium]|jgi:phosphate-selective porin OprO/OprP